MEEKEVTRQEVEKALREHIEDSGDIIDSTDCVQNIATDMFWEKILDEDGNPTYTQEDIDEGKVGEDYDSCKKDAYDEVYTTDDDPSVLERF